jgi:hypothetical protein
MSFLTEIKRELSELSRIPMRKKQHLQKNSYYLVVLKTGAVKNNKIKKELQVISWKLNVREGFLFPPPFSFYFKKKK